MLKICKNSRGHNPAQDHTGLPWMCWLEGHCSQPWRVAWKEHSRRWRLRYSLYAPGDHESPSRKKGKHRQCLCNVEFTRAGASKQLSPSVTPYESA